MIDKIKRKPGGGRKRKITIVGISDILTSKEKINTLADKYNVCPATIYLIYKRLKISNIELQNNFNK